MATNDPTSPADAVAALAAAASPDQAATILRGLWREHVLSFTARGVPADALARSLLDMGVRVGMDLWGPAATAAALTDTADAIRELPDFNASSNRH